MSNTHPAAGEHAASSVAYRIIRGMFIVLFFWIFWKFGGYIVTVLVIRRFGSGVVSDAYFFATQAVAYGLIFTPALAILVPAFMPVFVEERTRRGEEAAWAFARAVMTLVLIGCALMAVAVYLGAGPITDTLVSGFGPESRALGVKLLRWLLPGVVLLMLFLVLRAILNSYKVFGYPAAAEAAQKLLWVAVFAAAASLLGVQAVVIGFVAGSAAMVCICAYGLRGRARLLRPGLGAMSASRFGKELAVALAFLAGGCVALYGVARHLPASLARYRDLALVTVVLASVLAYSVQLYLRSRGRHGVMARFALLAVPLVISTFFASYRNVVTFYFQSFTARGIFTDIEGGRRIANFPVELVALALSVAMLPYLCELASRTDHAKLGDVVTKALRMLAVGFAPLTVLMIVLADPLSRLVLDRGDRSAMDLHYTTVAFQIFTIALVAYAAERVIMQGYFSLQRMWTPALLGIGATLLQVAFLAVPIYWLGMDYPLQVFFLVTLAYPLSRIVKNALLLLLLRRHVPVLPGRETLAFSAKLAVLSIVVGAAAYFALRWTERALPFEQYRQRKVVVDDFEAQPETWFAADADEVGIVPASGAPEAGAAMAMTYKRHGRGGVELSRELAGVRTAGARELSFAARFEKPAAGLGVRVSYPDGSRKVTKLDAAGSGWGTYAVPLDGREIKSVAWFETGPGQPEPNVLLLNDVRLMEHGGRTVFAEDFDRNGWQGAVGAEHVAVTSGQRQYAGYALRLGAGQQTAVKALAAYELAGTETFRCRLLNESAVEAKVQVTLEAAQKSFARSIVLVPGKWETVDVARRETGLDAADWQALSAVRVQPEGPHGSLYVDDVSFRRPARELRYLSLMVLYCAAPSLTALAVMLAGLAALRFEELSYVVQWVRARGWRRRHGEGEGLTDAPA